MKPFEAFLGLLQGDILGEEPKEPLPKEPDDAFWQTLYSISAGYDLAHIVAHRLGTLGITPGGGTAPQFEKRSMLALYRYEQMHYEYGRIQGVLEAAHIAFLPLKGLCLRRLYPEAYLRTSADLDILVKEEQLDRALYVLKEELHYKNENRGSHDVSLYSESGVHLELHFLLVEKNRISRAEEPLADVWQNACPVAKDSFEYRMEPALFYYYHIAHTAKHVASGGCGIRPILDLALIRRRLPVNEERTQAWLTAGGLATFARTCLELTDSWFGDQPYTPLAHQLATYITRGGVYGSVHNRIAAQKKGKGKVRYFLSRIWLPYATLIQLYPAARHRILVPFFQLRRILTRIFSKSLFRAAREARALRKLSNEECVSTQSLIKALGLTEEVVHPEEH